jgi:nucleotide-binding universal stress UspA family protein
MATRARTGIAEALLGSVASEVVRRAPNPTLLVGPEVHGGQPALTGPVIACLDGSALAAQGLPLAAAWAGALDRPLEAVTVARGTQDDVTGARRAAADHGATWQPLAGGPAAQVVAGHAPDDGLLVAATHGHSGLGRIAIGSVALRIVHDAPCPVLVVRPSGLR